MVENLLHFFRCPQATTETTTVRNHVQTEDRTREPAERRMEKTNDYYPSTLGNNSDCCNWGNSAHTRHYLVLSTFLGAQWKLFQKNKKRKTCNTCMYMVYTSIYHAMFIAQTLSYNFNKRQGNLKTKYYLHKINVPNEAQR